jgi:hypothetical protein
MEGVQQSLLDERSGEATLAGPHLAARDPPFGDGT